MYVPFNALASDRGCTPITVPPPVRDRLLQLFTVRSRRHEWHVFPGQGGRQPAISGNEGNQRGERTGTKVKE